MVETFYREEQRLLEESKVGIELVVTRPNGLDTTTHLLLYFNLWIRHHVCVCVRWQLTNCVCVYVCRKALT